MKCKEQYACEVPTLSLALVFSASCCLSATFKGYACTGLQVLHGVIIPAWQSAHTILSEQRFTKLRLDRSGGIPTSYLFRRQLRDTEFETQPGDRNSNSRLCSVQRPYWEIKWKACGRKQRCPKSRSMPACVWRK